MTGEDHDTALIAALRSPALPSEQVGEDAVVTAMLEAWSAAPARQTGPRSRRGIAIAAVTVASLGVGGLVAAGPGESFFFPAADRSPATAPQSTVLTSDVQSPVAPPIEDAASTTVPVGTTSTIVAKTAEPGTDLVPAGDDVEECDADRHGDAVSDVAGSAAGSSSVPGEVVRDVARSDCGKPDEAGGRGESPSDTAPGRTGDSPSDTAPGRTGDSPSDTAPGRTGDTPADTVARHPAPSDTVPAPKDPKGSEPGPDQSDGAASESDPAPDETVSADTVPADTVPADTAPADTAPTETAPADPVPADTRPGRSPDTGAANDTGRP